MKTIIKWLFTLGAIGLLLITSLTGLVDVSAEEEDSSETYTSGDIVSDIEDVDEVGDQLVLDEYTVATFIGNNELTEESMWSAVVSVTPVYCSDLETEIDTTWSYDRTTTSWISGSNLFSASILVGSTEVYLEYDGDYLTWDPIVYIAGTTVDWGYPILITYDYLDSSVNCTIKWTSDSGITRYLKLCAGSIIEYYVVESLPSGDIVVDSNVDESGGLEWDVETYIFDSEDTYLDFTENYDVITLEYEDMLDAVFPIVIDPDTNFTASYDSGRLSYTSSVYSTAQSATSADTKSLTGSLRIGQFLISNYSVNRGYLYFDTSSLDGVTVTSAYLYLYLDIDESDTDFDIIACSTADGGQTYPGSDLDYSDYYYDYYTTGGGTLSTSSFSGAGTYYTLTLNSTGYGWINTSGSYTWFVLRSSRDISVTTPTGDEYVVLGTYDSKLYVTYTLSTPVVTTSAATSVTSTTATLNGSLTSTGGEDCTVYFQYGTASGTYTSSTSTESGVGAGDSFDANITSLSEGTTYYFRSVAYNSSYTAYGTERSFTTSVGTPTATTNAATSIGSASATLNGYVSSDGGSSCTVYFQYGTASGTYGYTTTSDSGYETGDSFDVTLTTLSPGTTYYYRAVINNGTYTGYGGEASFTTTITTPAVTTNSASSLSSSSAFLNAYVSSDGGASCTVYFDYGIASGTYTSSTSSVSGKVTGDSTSIQITGLSAGTVYYYRAVINNGTYTGYGAERTLTTSSSLFTPTNVQALATSNYSVALKWTLGSGSEGTTIVYNTDHYPTSRTDGTIAYSGGNNYYTLEGLTAGTTYYFSLWGYSGTTYSTDYATTIVTTPAGTEAASTDTELDISSWFDITDTSVFSDLPLYSGISDLFTSYGLPASTGWMLFAITGVLILGILVGVFTKSGLAVAITVGVLWLINCALGLIYWWTAFIVVILVAFYFLVMRR